MCLNLCLLSAILLGVLYLCFGVRMSSSMFDWSANVFDQSFALVFSTNHGFNQWQTGLSFLGILVGMLIGVSCDPLWRKNCTFTAHALTQPGENGEDPQIGIRAKSSTDSRLVKNNDGVSEPEYRLPPTILGALLTPISLFVRQDISWSWHDRLLVMQGQYCANNVPAGIWVDVRVSPYAARLQPC